MRDGTQHKAIRQRTVFIYVVMVLIGIVITARVWTIQHSEYDRWAALSDSIRRENVRRDIEPVRGNIYSDDGELLAASVPRYKVVMDFGVEKLREDNGRLFYDNLDSLSICLSRFFCDKSQVEYRRQLLKGYKSRKRYFVLNNRQISHSEYKQMLRFPLFRLGKLNSGFNPEMHIKRIKPFGSLAAITIGNTQDDRPLNGIERAFNDYLKGKKGIGHVEKVAGMRILISDLDAENGADVKTTLNVDMQDICEKALRKQMQLLDAEVGAVILMETETGQIKSIVNLKRWADSSYREVESIALRSEMEPGSTFKIAAMMAALEDGTVKPTDTVDCGDGIWHVNEKITISDFNTGDNANHKITASQAIIRSSNVGMGKLIYDRYPNVKKAQHFVDMLHKIGVGKKIDFGFKGMAEPKILGPADRADWTSTDVASMAYGYSVNMPLLYTLTFFNAIANGGKMMKPYVVSEITHNGMNVKKFEPTVMQEQICSEQTLKEIKQMMLGVVEDMHGTAKPVQSDYVRIAGKTGTARYEYGSGNGWKHQVSFCGFFPYETPKYTCIVYMRNPKVGAASGGRMAGTVFKEIAERVMASVQFLPVDLFSKVEKAKEEHKLLLDVSRKIDTVGKRHKRTMWPTITELSRIEADIISREMGMDVNADNKINSQWVKMEYNRMQNEVRYSEALEGKNTVPNVSGMGLKDAVYRLEDVGLKVKVGRKNGEKGQPYGKVIEQSIKAGEIIKQGETIMIYVKR